MFLLLFCGIIMSAKNSQAEDEACSQPPSPGNGIVKMNGFEVHQSCNEGYSSQGVHKIYCLGSRSWTDSITCSLIDCGPPPPPSHGMVTLDDPGNTEYGATATQACDEGYGYSGNKTICCGASGWTSSINCTIISCGLPTEPGNGTVYLTKTDYKKFGATANQSCNTGFEIIGPPVIYCLASGKWSQSAVCVTLDCHVPSAPAQGTVILNTARETTYGATANQSCDIGYQQVGDSILHCEADGEWRSKVLCLIRDCGVPSAPKNGFVTLNDSQETTYGAIANQSCDIGYELVGNFSRHCDEDGQWSTGAECIIKNCRNPSSPDHGRVRLTKYGITSYGATATVECEELYKLAGSAVIYCQENGTWTKLPDCVFRVYLVIIPAVTGAFGIGLVSLAGCLLACQHDRIYPTHTDRRNEQNSDESRENVSNASRVTVYSEW